MQHIAILKLKPEASGEAQTPYRRSEVERVWQPTVSGALRSVHFFCGEVQGAFFQLETSDRSEAEAAVQSLPIVAAGLLQAEILTLAPFTGLAALFAAPGGA